MLQEIFEWLLLLGRWIHITTAMAWIGTSIFFMWLDRSFEFNEKAKREGHIGDLWMVHGGGFYNVEKLKMGSVQVPEHLHWFKWESYWTWMSGLFLLTLIFYTGGGTFLIDSSVSNLTFGPALAIAIFSIVVSWLFYDFLWDSKITKEKPVVGHALTLLWFAGMSYFLCHTLSGRAAYIHIGAMLGTWMTANVFLRIIPRQVKMVEAAKKGEPVNQDWGINAKNRSTHNTYFTLPVIFIMLSNHFPFTYGNKLNWLILLLVSAAGAAIRHYFVIRLANPPRAKTFAAAGIAIILGVMFFTSENTGSSRPHEHQASTPASATDTTSSTHEGHHLVKGVINFEGPVPPREKLQLPFACMQNGDVYDNNILVTNGKLQNVVVHVVKGLEGKSFPDVPAEIAILDQLNCLYEPRVIAARVGQKVEFINSDSVFHNVRSITKNNEEFNVSMPNKNDRVIKIFDKAEFVLQTKCSVHPWMSGYVAVMDHPYYSISNEAGEFAIHGLPPGQYTLEAWHEVFGKQTADITVTENKSLEVNFSFKK